MFQSFYLCRVSCPIASSVKSALSVARRISARPANIALTTAITIAPTSDRIESTSLTGPTFANLGSTGWCE